MLSSFEYEFSGQMSLALLGSPFHLYFTRKLMLIDLIVLGRGVIATTFGISSKFKGCLLYFSPGVRCDNVVHYFLS